MKYLIVGGGGFIGSYVVDMLLSKASTSKVIVYDNFCSGKKWHLKEHLANNKFKLIEKDIYDKDIFDCSKNIDVTIMLAANADIAAATTDPQVDFNQGTYLLQIVLNMRKVVRNFYMLRFWCLVKQDMNLLKICPMEPISTYRT